MGRCFSRRFAPVAKDGSRKFEDCALGLAQGRLHRPFVGGRIAEQDRDAGIDHADQAILGKVMFGDRGRERIGDRVSGPRAGRRKVDRVAPPLQTNLARHRFRYKRQDVVQLCVESVKRKKPGLLGGGGKQGAPIAVAIALPDDCRSSLVVASLFLYIV